MKNEFSSWNVKSGSNFVLLLQPKLFLVNQVVHMYLHQSRFFFCSFLFLYSWFGIRLWGTWVFIGMHMKGNTHKFVEVILSIQCGHKLGFNYTFCTKLFYVLLSICNTSFLGLKLVILYIVGIGLFFFIHFAQKCCVLPYSSFNL